VKLFDLSTSFVDRDMVMRFFGGGVGHSQSLRVEHQHPRDSVMLSDPDNESESEYEMDRIEIPVRKDVSDDPMESDNDQDVEDITEKEVEDSDNGSLSRSDQEIDSELESDDGYDSF
jgi:hypothetical protein